MKLSLVEMKCFAEDNINLVSPAPKSLIFLIVSQCWSKMRKLRLVSHGEFCLTPCVTWSQHV